MVASTILQQFRIQLQEGFVPQERVSIVWGMKQVGEQASLRRTEATASVPGRSVCGCVGAHAHALCFGVAQGMPVTVHLRE